MNSDIKVLKQIHLNSFRLQFGDLILEKEKRKLSEKMLLIKRKKKPGLKSNPGLMLIGLFLGPILNHITT